ncbi:hypothetical protein H2198_005817 [Neophaeococcomyces mojaviensis]|uniref:Uncharacterized protein n=1 Tax=Neophaeococcomyces mojaviensis TaxID=3383035 RepID=A0ACC3A4L9_9EURO|nr:hypothetical protein H2198_005817 [Knufia sp. JES_112]
MNSTVNATIKAAVNSTWYPLKDWNNFEPFRIDALGLVTLLGAPEVNNNVGKLVRSKYLEYLPLLGAYIIANDEFTDKQPGFQLYNINKSIYTPDIAGWFTRWLMAQDIRTAASCVDWNVESVEHGFGLEIFISGLIGIILNGGFIVLTVLMGDWWGFSNAMSMTASIVARTYLVSRNRRWLDKAIENAIKRDDPRALRPIKDKSKTRIIDQDSIAGLKWDRLIVVLSDARAVIVRVPACLVVDCFVFNPKPPNATNETKRAKSLPPRQKQEDKKPVSDPPQIKLYRFVRGVAWLAFGAHAITIGMSKLVSQIVTVLIIVFPTILLTMGFGSDDMRVGSRLRANIFDFPHVSEAAQKRVDMYAFLNLTKDQEDSLRRWGLAPHETNKAWWDDYEERKKRYNEDEIGRPKPLIDMVTFEERKNALVSRSKAATQQPQKTGSVAMSCHTSHSTT